MVVGEAVEAVEGEDEAAPMPALEVRVLRVEALTPMAISHLFQRRQSQLLKVPGVPLRWLRTKPPTHLLRLAALGQERLNRIVRQRLLPLLRLDGVILLKLKPRHGVPLVQRVLGAVIPILVSMDQLLLQSKPLLQLLLYLR